MIHIPKFASSIKRMSDKGLIIVNCALYDEKELLYISVFNSFSFVFPKTQKGKQAGRILCYQE